MAARARRQQDAVQQLEAELDAQIDRCVDSAAADVFSGKAEAERADARLDALLESSLRDQASRSVDVPPLQTDELRDEYARRMQELLDAPGQNAETAAALVQAWGEYARAEKEAIEQANASGEGFDLQGAIDRASSEAERAVLAARVPPRLLSSLRRLGRLRYASTLPPMRGAAYLLDEDSAYGVTTADARKKGRAKGYERGLRAHKTSQQAENARRVVAVYESLQGNTAERDKAGKVYQRVRAEMSRATVNRILAAHRKEQRTR